MRRLASIARIRVSHGILLLVAAVVLVLALPSETQAKRDGVPGSFVVNNPGLISMINVTDLGTWDAHCEPAAGPEFGVPGSIGATICTGVAQLFLIPNPPDHAVVTHVSCSFQAFSPGGDGPVIASTENGVVTYSRGDVRVICPAN
jgi:hypothetical protein